jgi:hypothetical protein
MVILVPEVEHFCVAHLLCEDISLIISSYCHHLPAAK